MVHHTWTIERYLNAKTITGRNFTFDEQKSFIQTNSDHEKSIQKFLQAILQKISLFWNIHSISISIVSFDKYIDNNNRLWSIFGRDPDDIF